MSYGCPKNFRKSKDVGLMNNFGKPYDGKLSRTVLRAVSTDPYSLLALSLGIQIVTGVMLAMICA